MPHGTLSTAGLVLAGSAAVLLGAGAGYLLARRRRGAPDWSSAPLGTGARLLPDPGLGWLARAHHALGAWCLEGLDPEHSSLARSPEVDALDSSASELIEAKLLQLLAVPGNGVERVPGGTLVHVSRPGALGALLLRGHDPQRAGHATSDLEWLVEALQYQRALLPTREIKSPVESLDAVSLSLALQLERLASTGVIIVVNLHGGAHVVARSPLVDPRRKLDRVEPNCPVQVVLRGESDYLDTPYDPLGSDVHDRRRQPLSHIVGIGPAASRVGAVILTPARTPRLEGPLLADIMDAIAGMQTALVNARVVHELKQSATTDALTGLKNRRGFEAELTRVGSEGGALVYADLDRFKQLNDTLGHPAGDAALVHFAGIIREEVRQGDTAGRIGGEEFAIWLPGANVAVGRRIAERIRELLGTRIFQWQGQHWPLSASFGVAACPETTRTRLNLPSQADAALYQAKNGGRNRVVVARSSIA